MILGWNKMISIWTIKTNKKLFIEAVKKCMKNYEFNKILDYEIQRSAIWYNEHEPLK